MMEPLVENLTTTSTWLAAAAVEATTADGNAGAADENAGSIVTTLTLVLSGVFFACTGVGLVYANANTPQDIKSLPMDRRLDASMKIMTFVCVFSGFFNIFQLTELDDALLPRTTVYTMDMARPVEWIITCPMLQAILVILGGPFVPNNRLVVMPALSLAVLLAGTASLFWPSPLFRMACYFIGLMLATAMFQLDRRQILEVTGGEEGLLKGGSWFRCLSFFTVITWVPFPAWFLLSPEGIGIITNFDVIQVGWGVLNLTSKIGFAILLQRYKNSYFAAMAKGFDQTTEAEEMPKQCEFLDINTLLDDTLEFLGMHGRTKEFKRSLKRANIRNCTDLFNMTEVTCKEVNLPWGPVFAAKRRMFSIVTDPRFNNTAEGGYGDNAAKPHKFNPGDSSAVSTAANSFERAEYFLHLFSKGLSCGTDIAQEVLEEAKAALLDETSLDLIRARVHEIRGYQNIHKFMSKSKTFKEALEGNDVDEVTLAVDAAGATGFETDKMKDTLEKLSEARKVCRVHVRTGIAHFKQGSFEDAFDSFTEALASDPRAVDALLNRAATSTRLGDYAGAEDDAAHCLDIDPTNEKAYQKQVNALLNLGLSQAAAHVLKTGLRHHASSQALLALRKRLGESQVDQATQTYDMDEEMPERPHHLSVYLRGEAIVL